MLIRYVNLVYRCWVWICEFGPVHRGLGDAPVCPPFCRCKSPYSLICCCCTLLSSWYLACLLYPLGAGETLGLQTACTSPCVPLLLCRVYCVKTKHMELQTWKFGYLWPFSIMIIIEWPRITICCMKPPRNCRGGDPDLETAGIWYAQAHADIYSQPLDGPFRTRSPEPVQIFALRFPSFKS